MNRALFLLLLLSIRGRFVRRLRLLRQPRYLVGLLIGLAYFATVFAPRFLGVSVGRPTRGNLGLGDFVPVVQWAAALILALVATLAWILVTSRPALRLSESEIHLLLPAPLTRRRILEFALLKQQAGILFGTVIVRFFLRGGYLTGQRLALTGASWALLTLIDLHLKGIAFWKAGLSEMPAAAAYRRRALAIVVGIAFWTVVAFCLLHAWNATGGGAGPLDKSGFRALGRGLAAALGHGPLAVLLAPFLWLAGPFLGAGSWLGALFLLLLIAAHYEWVVRSSAHFEEATLARAQRQLARRGRRPRFERQSARLRGRSPFALAETGLPELAIYWKNLMLLGRTPLRRQAAGLAALLALLTAGVAIFGAPAAVTVPIASIGAMLLILPPLAAGLFFRNDLRSDLLQVEILRSWPIAGWRLVAAELLAPATGAFRFALGGAGLVLAAAAATWLGGGHQSLAESLPGPLAGLGPAPLILVLGIPSLLLVGLPVALISVGIQNLAALLLPGWIGLGMERRRGTAVLGQRILVLVGQLLVLLVAALPAALAVGAVLLLHYLARRPLTVWELPLLAIVAALPLVAIVGLVARLGGALWERLDPARELLEQPD